MLYFLFAGQAPELLGFSPIIRAPGWHQTEANRLKSRGTRAVEHPNSLGTVLCTKKTTGLPVVYDLSR